jgi:hypothetical protein
MSFAVSRWALEAGLLLQHQVRADVAHGSKGDVAG